MSKRSFQLLLVACLVASALWAADDPFTGHWKLNPSNSRFPDEMKVKAAGANKYAFDFGAGNPETIVADGTDQPGIFGTTLAVTVEGPDTWKVVRKKDGRTLLTAIWKLSQDGKTLSDAYIGGANRWPCPYHRWFAARPVCSPSYRRWSYRVTPEPFQLKFPRDTSRASNVIAVLQGLPKRPRGITNT